MYEVSMEKMLKLEEKLGIPFDKFNSPLMIHNLRKMQGEPIWIEGINIDGCWATYSISTTTAYPYSKPKDYEVIAVLPNDINLPPLLSSYGDSWLAYKHPKNSSAFGDSVGYVDQSIDGLRERVSKLENELKCKVVDHKGTEQYFNDLMDKIDVEMYRRLTENSPFA